MLCEDCEQLLSKYERYASLVLNGGFELEAILDPPLVHYKNFKYKEFKLFALSILWRAGVAENDNFARVKLGPHENRIREMLLNEVTVEEHAYPFVLMPLMHNGEIVESLIAPPEKTKVGNQHAYFFIFGGLAWVFIVSNHMAPKDVLGASISKAGQLTMLPTQIKDMKHLVSYARQFVALGKV